MGSAEEQVSEAFQRIYIAESRRLRAFVVQRMPNADDADDVLQDVWLKFYNKLLEGGDIDQPGAWLFTVAKNRITDFYRRRLKDATAAQELRYLVDDLDTSSTSGLGATGNQRLNHMEGVDELIWERIVESVARLPEHQRTAFWATEIDGKSFKQLAQESDTHIGTWLSRKHYAIRTLRKYLDLFYKELLDME